LYSDHGDLPAGAGDADMAVAAVITSQTSNEKNRYSNKLCSATVTEQFQFVGSLKDIPLSLADLAAVHYKTK
jgi:hypothetical protein